MKLYKVKYKDIEQIPHLTLNKEFKQDFQGSAPTPFVGRSGYPNINVGILSPQFIGNVEEYDSPKLWSLKKTEIGTIATLRSELVNSRKLAHIDDPKKTSTFIDLCQEVAMAKTAAEVEIELIKKLNLSYQPEREIIPFGPTSEIKKAQITTNTKIDQQVEKVVNDTDLFAKDGLFNLYQKGFEENTLSKLLSVGTLGLKNNRKLVPTRWSITATDDQLGKNLISEIKKFSFADFQVYFGGEWGNYYLIILLPEVWSYELFETYLSEKINPWSKSGYAYSTDYESYEGRKTYAEECAGGYYAPRLAVLEKLKEMKRQGSILVMRFITDEYKLPLGVWVCRQATRKALLEKPISFSSEELLLSYVKTLLQKKFSFNADLLLSQSKILKNKKVQHKLSHFI